MEPGDLVPTGAVVLLAFVVALPLQGRVRAAANKPLIVQAFLLHVCAVFANMAVVQRLYNGRGDMFQFIKDGRAIALSVRADFFGMFPELVSLFFHQPSLFADLVHGSVGTHSMSAAAGLGCLLFQDSMLAVSMACGLASFFGKAFLFLAVRDFFPRAWERHVMGVTLFVPSVVFWSAGLIKESFVITGLGCAALGARMLLGRQSVGLLPLVVGVLLMAYIKPYMLMTTGAGVVAFAYWSRAVRHGKLQVRPIRLAMTVVAGLLLLAVIGSIFPRFALSNLFEETARLSAAGQRGGSSFSLGVDLAGAGSATLAVYSIPAILTALYRPAFFDITSAQVAVNALETTFVLYMSIAMVRRHGIKGTLRLPLRYPFLAFCIPMVLVTAFGVGISTGNLGTLSRYRMPLMPFFALWLLVGHRAPRERATARSLARPAGLRARGARRIPSRG